MDEHPDRPRRHWRRRLTTAAVLVVLAAGSHALLVPDGTWRVRLAFGAFVGGCWVLGAWMYDTAYAWRMRRYRRAARPR